MIKMSAFHHWIFPINDLFTTAILFYICAASVVAKPVEMLPNEIKADDISGTNVEQDNSGKKVVYWEDPMVEGRHFSKSGKSPFMDMQLAPSYAE